jgi:hypothetical protein
MYQGKILDTHVWPGRDVCVCPVWSLAPSAGQVEFCIGQDWPSSEYDTSYLGSMITLSIYDTYVQKQFGLHNCLYLNIRIYSFRSNRHIGV